MQAHFNQAHVTDEGLCMTFHDHPEIELTAYDAWRLRKILLPVSQEALLLESMRRTQVGVEQETREGQVS